MRILLLKSFVDVPFSSSIVVIILSCVTIWCKISTSVIQDILFCFFFLRHYWNHIILLILKSKLLFIYHHHYLCSDYLFKLLLIGDSGVGKSCLLLRFAVSAFNLIHNSSYLIYKCLYYFFWDIPSISWFSYLFFFFF